MNTDASGRRIVGKQWQAYRCRMFEHRLRLWRRLEKAIDPARNPDAGRMVASAAGGSPGMASEAVAEATACVGSRAAVEASGSNGRYFQQPDPRKLRDRYLPRLKQAIFSAYKIGPVTADDLVVLETCLRRYVSDEHLRRELFDRAQAAAACQHGR